MPRRYLPRSVIGLVLLCSVAPSVAGAEVFVEVGPASAYFCVYASDGTTTLERFNGVNYVPASFSKVLGADTDAIAATRAKIAAATRLLRATRGAKKRAKLIATIARLSSQVNSLRTESARIRDCKKKVPYASSSGLMHVEYQVVPYDVDGARYFYGGAFLVHPALSFALAHGGRANFGDQSQWCVSALTRLADGSSFLDTDPGLESEVTLTADPCHSLGRANGSCPDLFNADRIGLEVVVDTQASSGGEALDNAADRVGATDFLLRPKPAIGCIVPTPPGDAHPRP